jgi:hypothetical protein
MARVVGSVIVQSFVASGLYFTTDARPSIQYAFPCRSTLTIVVSEVVGLAVFHFSCSLPDARFANVVVVLSYVTLERLRTFPAASASVLYRDVPER